MPSNVGVYVCVLGYDTYSLPLALETKVYSGFILFGASTPNARYSINYTNLVVATVRATSENSCLMGATDRPNTVIKGIRLLIAQGTEVFPLLASFSKGNIYRFPAEGHLGGFVNIQPVSELEVDSVINDTIVLTVIWNYFRLTRKCMLFFLY